MQASTELLARCISASVLSSVEVRRSRHRKTPAAILEDPKTLEVVVVSIPLRLVL